MKRILLIVCILVTGCLPTMPGMIKTSVSEFDNSKEIVLEPAWVCKSKFSCSMRLGLHRRSTMPAEDVILTAVVSGAHNFSDGASLHFNIDGVIVDLTSLDTVTDIFTITPEHNSASEGTWSSKQYEVNREFIKKLIQAKRVVVKIDLRKSFVEGIFSEDGANMARPSFQRFYQRAFEVSI